MKDYWQSLMSYIKEISSALHTDPWVLQVFIVVFLTMVLSYVQRQFMQSLHKRLGRIETLWDKALINAVQKPLSALIYIVGLTLAVEIIFKATGSAIFDPGFIDPLRTILIIITITWFLTRLVNKSAENFITSRQALGEQYDQTAVDAVAKLLRISVIIVAALMTLQTLGFSISGVLAFGGMGGIVIGFAARDLLANFFGGMMVYLDRPFSVGDWVRSPDRDIEGTVEEIGWRLTRMRTFDKRELYVPNHVFNTVTLENPSRMWNRRIKEVVGVRYDDAGKVAAIVRDIREMIKNHPDIDTNQTLIVNFDAFAASSLNILVYTFTKTRDWVEYHSIKEDVMLKIIDIIDSYGAECAFPTTTVHVPDGIRTGELADAEKPDSGQQAASSNRTGSQARTGKAGDQYGDVEAGQDDGE